MKRIIYILFFFLPVVVSAQFDLYKDSPLDYVWKYVGSAGFSAGQAYYTSLGLSPSGEPYVAYRDWNNSLKATVMRFDGTNWVIVGNAGFSAGEANWISLAFSPTDGDPYVAYCDGGYDYKATVMKFNGTIWVNVGTAGFSKDAIVHTSLAFSPSGQPYVAYEDCGNSFKATVKKFDGTHWVNVGTAGFSADDAYCESLAFSPIDGDPYVGYRDMWNSQKATVMKFDGTNWVYVGNAGFSEGEADFESLAFSPSGEPYIAYQDAVNSSKATVMKFDGTNWVNVGNAGFSAGWVSYISLAFSPTDGDPYVAYEDQTYGDGFQGHATVMKFDGTNWVNVGKAGFSAGDIWYTSFAFSPSGEPYVAFTDWVNSYKATVMKYDSVLAGINEKQQSQLSIYPNPSSTQITIETSTTPATSQLSIINTNGQELISRQVTTPKTMVDISTLPSGVYIVKVTGELTVQVGKLIKQ